MRIKRQEEEAFEIPLIPMIDCMLVIIIFFLVATTMKDKEKELPLELPDSAAAFSTAQDPGIFIIGVDKAGQVYLGDEPVSTERLHQRLQDLAKANPRQRIRIDGDRNVIFQHIVRIVDLCQFEGLSNVGIHTAKPGGK